MEHKLVIGEMNNSLKNKIVSQFNTVLDKKWADFSSVPWLINYIEANVTNQHNIWTNIEQNLRKVTQSAGKNVRVAEANLLEVKFKMQNLSNDAMSESQCEKIIQLVNEVSGTVMSVRPLYSSSFIAPFVG